MEHILLKGLLLLSLCSVFGSALRCYECETDEDSLCTKKECSIKQDTCLNVTFHSKQLFRRCWNDKMCTSKELQAAFSIDTSLSFTCCSWDLCNSKNGGTPRADANPFLLGLLAAFAGLHVSWFRS